MPKEATEVRHSGRPEPADLVARIRGGDPAAEAELMEIYGPGLGVLLQRHTRSRTEAEDLHQEALATALEKLRAGELRNPSRLAGFLAALARNLAVEHYRKVARRRTEADSETVAGTLDPAQESQLGGLLRRENAELVRRTMAELRNSRDREILYRFYLADEDKESIAADLDLDRGQFNRVLHRARQRYKTLYEAKIRELAQLQALKLAVFWTLLSAALVGQAASRVIASFGPREVALP